MDFMHGGSLLGKGSYGCVFRPPLLCKSKQGPPYRITGDLTKISIQRDADREYKMGKIVQAIPLSSNYFLPVLEECEVAPKQTDEDIDECDIVDDNPVSKLRLLSMKYGGESMSQMDIKRFKTADDFWKFGKHLLEGAALLSVNGIIHRDLHRGNVLVDTYMVGRIIDFGISIKYNDSIDVIQKEMIRDYDPEYTQEPPEYNVWFGEGKLDDVLDKKPSLMNARTVLGVTRDEQVASAKEFFAMSRSFKERDFASFWKYHWIKYDGWSVGAILASIMKMILVGPMGKMMEGSQLERMRGVIRKLLAFNPFARYNLMEALHEWDGGNRVVELYGRKWLRHD